MFYLWQEFLLEWITFRRVYLLNELNRTRKYPFQGIVVENAGTKNLHLYFKDSYSDIYYKRWCIKDKEIIRAVMQSLREDIQKLLVEKQQKLDDKKNKTKEDCSTWITKHNIEIPKQRKKIPLRQIVFVLITAIAATTVVVPDKVMETRNAIISYFLE